MLHSLTVNDFLDEAAEKGVIIDVRTPAEYAKGHIIGAVNMPLFTNEERATVGTLYLRVSREEAIEKGLEFVGPRMANMVRQAKHIAQGRSIYLYCWRGGMRSGSVAWLLSTAGLKVSVLKGGYKAYRRNFEQLLEQDSWKFVLLSGSTGCGKTELLHHLAKIDEQILDLEELAHHKGSAFGGIGHEEQPTTEHFANKLHHCFRQFNPLQLIWCEAESMSIGNVFMPKVLYDKVRSNINIRIEMDTEQRLDRLMLEYGTFPAQALIDSFQKISKRFGYDQTKLAVEYIENGQIREAAAMALSYYDKSYRKTTKDENRISFTANNEDMKLSAQKLKELLYKIGICK